MRSAIRWAAVHAVVRFAAKRGAALGDPQAMLVADPATRADPRAVYEELRAKGPLLKTRISNITVDHATVFELLRSDDFRTTITGGSLPAPLRAIEKRTRSGSLHPLLPPSLLSVEPPDHTRYRKLVSSVFTVRAVQAMREMVQRRADELLDTLVADAATDSTIDIIDSYCSQLPVAVISQILGVPDSERSRVLEFGELAAPSLDLGVSWTQFKQVEAGLDGFDAWLMQHIRELRRNPGDNLLSQLIAATEDGVGLTDMELRATAGLVLAAGFETTVNLLGSGIHLLTEHPDQLDVLQKDPSHWPTAVDEMLRLESPVRLTARVAKKDVVVAGVPMKEGELAVLVLAGANRDPSVFPDPYRFDVTRENARMHLSFSGGRHYCLGAALARAEAEVGLRALFDRFPELRSAGEGVKRDTRVLNGYLHLPVILGEPVSQSV